MASKPRKLSVHESANPNCGKKLIALCICLKMTQSELAKRVGTSPMSISRWEAGSHQPSAKYLIKLGTLANPGDCWLFWEKAGLTVADVMRVILSLRNCPVKFRAFQLPAKNPRAEVTATRCELTVD
jgi:transcriptional regulator with XRE-family HTH domain